jgi:metalloendopeptidase OMA1, mitochondrial
MTLRTGPRQRAFAAAGGVVLVAVVLGCGVVAPPEQQQGRGRGEGPGGRQQPLAMTPQQELAVGLRAYREVMQEYGDRVLPESAPEVRRVRQITMRIAKAAEIEPLQREINLRIRGYRFEWEANVIRERQANAFCLPAGKVFVFTGILPIAADDGQLAAVLSHEIAHALAHHASERVARERGGSNIFGSLRYDRMQESEADHIGVFLMPFAGYDPDEAVEFWKRMLAKGGGGPPEFLSDHPSPEHRIRDLEQWAPKAKAAKAAYDRGDIAPPR